MELEVCTSLGSMFHRRGALFVNEIRPANDAGWNGRKSPCCRPRVLCWCSWKPSFSRSNAGADCWWQCVSRVWRRTHLTSLISRCNTRKIRRRGLFSSFLHFSMEYEIYSRRRIGSESKEEFEEKPSNGETKLFDQRDRLVPRGAVESLTIYDWSVAIGGSNPSTCVKLFLFFFFSFFYTCMSASKVLFSLIVHVLWLTRARNSFRLNFLLYKVSVCLGEFQ